MKFAATGMGYAQAIGRIGSILAPTLIAMLLVTGIDPKMAFATFAVPSILAALGYLLVQEKYGSFDKLVEDDQVHEEGVAVSLFGKVAANFIKGTRNNLFYVKIGLSI